MNHELLLKPDTGDLIPLLRNAKAAIEEGNFRLARDLLKQAVAVEIESAAVYNLLAISYEKEGNYVKAAKFYRVAYYLDQNYKAAEHNLDRVCSFGTKQTDRIEWGLKEN